MQGHLGLCSYRPRIKKWFIWLKRDKKRIFPLCTKRFKSDQKETSWAPKVTFETHFGGREVSFWSLLSLFGERGKGEKGLFSVSFESDKWFLDSGPVATSRFLKLGGSKRTHGEFGIPRPQAAKMHPRNQRKHNKTKIGLTTGTGLRLGNNDYKLFRFSSYTLSLGQKCAGGHLF